MRDEVLLLDHHGMARLLPMHLLIDPAGQIKACGPTLRKFIGPADKIADAFQDSRQNAVGSVLDLLHEAGATTERIFLKLLEPPHLVLRGHAVFTASGDILVNLGLGIELTRAVSCCDLTDSDFAPPELAMELLFLHEANRVVMGQLTDSHTLLEKARAAAEMQAHTDALTGLANRRSLDLVLDAVFRGRDGQEEGWERAFTLMHLDLDGFKQVNDCLGHDAGDQVLCRVAEILTELTRHDDFVARVGGDEFVLVLPGLFSHEDLLQFGRRIIAAIETIPKTIGCFSRVSASIGMTRSVFAAGRSAEQIVKDADTALYRAKNTGRGRAVIFEGETGEGDAILPPIL